MTATARRRPSRDASSTPATEQRRPLARCAADGGPGSGSERCSARVAEDAEIYCAEHRRDADEGEVRLSVDEAEALLRTWDSAVRVLIGLDEVEASRKMENPVPWSPVTKAMIDGHRLLMLRYVRARKAAPH
jgi:hypothetical protein